MSLIKLHKRLGGQRRNGSLISLSRWNESTTIYSSTLVPCHKTVWLMNVINKTSLASGGTTEKRIVYLFIAME